MIGANEEEIPLIQRQTGVVISKQAHKDSDEEDLDHSKKLKGIETLFKDAQFMINMKKARKASKDDFILQQRSKRSGSNTLSWKSCQGDSSKLNLPDHKSVLTEPKVEFERSIWAGFAAALAFSYKGSPADTRL
ncbi:hypothetical protein Tco_1079115 [Tanacetum coccineum]|uniref:Uncharacterized protein n=1 Tax=Tanacetum coccineum TaxID=301880 RepID=A0ABQ5HSH7_9ASTR